LRPREVTRVDGDMKSPGVYEVRQIPRYGWGRARVAAFRPVQMPAAVGRKFDRRLHGLSRVTVERSRMSRAWTTSSPRKCVGTPGGDTTCASAGTVSATNNATRSTGTGRRIAPALRAFAQQRYDLGVHGRVLGVADDDFAQAPPRSKIICVGQYSTPYAFHRA